MQMIIFILLYIDDVVFFTYTMDNRQQLMYWKHSAIKLIVNMNKIKIMVAKAYEPTHKPVFYIQGRTNIEWHKASNMLILMSHQQKVEYIWWV